MILENNTAHGTTFQFAEINGIKAETVLKRHCVTGSYYGVIPQKKPNGHLMWPLIGAWEVREEGVEKGEK